MEKKIWTAPKAEVEQFMANEYVAACGDSGVVYKFNCNAAGGSLYYYPNSDGVIDGVYKSGGKASYVGIYTPCGEKHDAESTADFYDGFVDRNGNGKCDSGEEVIVWLEWGNSFFGPMIRDGHATAILNKNEWETAKS